MKFQTIHLAPHLGGCQHSLSPDSLKSENESEVNCGLCQRILDRQPQKAKKKRGRPKTENQVKNVALSLPRETMAWLEAQDNKGKFIRETLEEKMKKTMNLTKVRRGWFVCVKEEELKEVLPLLPEDGGYEIYYTPHPWTFRLGKWVACLIVYQRKISWLPESLSRQLRPKFELDSPIISTPSVEYEYLTHYILDKCDRIVGECYFGHNLVDLYYNDFRVFGKERDRLCYQTKYLAFEEIEEIEKGSWKEDGKQLRLHPIQINWINP